MAEKRVPLWGRWTGLGLGSLTLLWTGVEDVHIWYFAGLSILWCSWGALVLRRGRGFKFIWQAALWGAAAGLAVTPFTLFLVSLKGGLHGHGFADLSISQIRQLTRLSPWWVAAGGVLGGLAARLARS